LVVDAVTRAPSVFTSTLVHVTVHLRACVVALRYTTVTFAIAFSKIAPVLTFLLDVVTWSEE
jgi:hypothetical protein